MGARAPADPADLVACPGGFVDDYTRLRKEQPDLFRNDDGPGSIDIIEAEQAGADTGPFGVVYEDVYIRLLRDPVRFPDGRVADDGPSRRAR